MRAKESLVLVLALASGVTACGSSSIATRPHVFVETVAKPAPGPLSVRTIDGRSLPTLRHLVAVARADGSLKSVRIGIPPRGWSSGARPRGHQRWAYITVKSGYLGAFQMHAEWQAGVVAGTVRARLGDGSLTGITTVLEYPGGVHHATSSRLGSEPDRRSPSASNVVRIFRRFFEGALHGRGSVFIKLWRPSGIVVSITIKATNPRQTLRYLEHHPLPSVTLDGLYIELQNHNGRPIAVLGDARAAGGRLSWVRSDFAEGA